MGEEAGGLLRLNELLEFEFMYSAIGRAVMAAQVLETWLVPVFEIYRIHSEPGRLERTGGIISAGSFKVPMSNLIKMLRDREHIDPDLEGKFIKYIEDRHLLVHRWLHDHEYPRRDDPAAYTQLKELAERVEQQATELGKLVLGYVVKYGEPDWAAANPEEYSERMTEIFKLAGQARE